MTSVADNNPRIYVACLAAYNNGYLHGAWIDADQDADEYAIHDYEGFEGVTIEEYASIDSVARMGAFIAERGALGAGLLEQFVGDIDQAESALQDCYHGQFASLADYMEELIAESITIPEALRYYVDWDAMARDAEMSGEFFMIEITRDEVHVFSNR
ncbi:antirestriction protein ArdA [Chelatococcus daeguensis]|uniref:antirestriction protein ArdA n=1 Tax=Chelatococcus daeguensis TaxID=444444 RepID=UPI0007AB5AF9|nr:antirestriction protein ArdA [Chelatococcus daeguensis]KZE34497.1 antirestriction protein [Chelatococcus daeguensis]MBM3083051.1 antirestriction protein ArdA [Chelatococcus daeguensis]